MRGLVIGGHGVGATSRALWAQIRSRRGAAIGSGSGRAGRAFFIRGRRRLPGPSPRLCERCKVGPGLALAYGVSGPYESTQGPFGRPICVNEGLLGGLIGAEGRGARREAGGDGRPGREAPLRRGEAYGPATRGATLGAVGGGPLVVLMRRGRGGEGQEGPSFGAAAITEGARLLGPPIGR